MLFLFVLNVVKNLLYKLIFFLFPRTCWTQCHQPVGAGHADGYGEGRGVRKTSSRHFGTYLFHRFLRHSHDIHAVIFIASFYGHSIMGKGKIVAGVSSQFYHRIFTIAVLSSQLLSIYHYDKNFICINCMMEIIQFIFSCFNFSTKQSIKK